MSHWLYADSKQGLYYSRFRYYDPEAGQYISQDPIGLAGGNPTLYGYVGDVNCWADPLALSGFFAPSTLAAPSGNTHTVYQEIIDWDLPSRGKGGITETNLDRALRGEAPFVQENGRH